MNIITLFCKMDDFFLLTKNGRARIVYERRRPWKHADALGNRIRAK